MLCLAPPQKTKNTNYNPATNKPRDSTSERKRGEGSQLIDNLHYQAQFTHPVAKRVVSPSAKTKVRGVNTACPAFLSPPADILFPKVKGAASPINQSVVA